MRKNECHKAKYYYFPDEADNKYRFTLVESRKGLNLTYDEYKSLDITIKEGIDKNQSIYHIVKANPDTIPVSVKSVYNYINNGKITVKPIDLPRSVSLKKRKTHALSQYEYKENKRIDRTGRKYSDWLVFRAKNKVVVYWEMDFLGAPKNSEQMILVLTIPIISFTILYPLKRPDMNAVKDVFNMIYKQLGEMLFCKIFEAILTDRDSRFNNFKDIETDSKTGVVRTHIFFCNPGASNEKPSVENMNQQLRLIFPKGISLSNISLEQGYFYASNMNARILSSIDDTTPAQLFINIFGKEAFDLLNLTLIDPKDVILNPIKV
jgi:IS30 family transposase